MPEGKMWRTRGLSLTWTVAVCLFVIPLIAPGSAAQRGGFGGGPPAAARDSAPVDLTGYWVSIVTEDWIERMAPDSPPSGTGGGRGGFGRGGAPQPASNPDDPCRVYGAGGSLRVPGRVNISWVDDSTLQIALDAGTQTRTLHFNPDGDPPTESSLQGYSVANWEVATGGRGGRGRGRGGAATPPPWGRLRVVTTNLTGGYLLTSRSNYSDNTVLTEDFIYHSDFGEEYFTVSAIVQDGGSTRITSSTFKKEPDGSGFRPSGCDIVR